MGDGVGPRLGITAEQGRGVGGAPREKCGIVDQSVFDDLGVSRAQLAQGQRIERVRIGEHQRWLVKGADQVLARRGIDCGLAADTGIDLREQRRGELDKAAAALEDRRGKPGQVADDAPAERQDMIAAFDVLGQEPVSGRGDLRPAFACLARGKDVPARLMPGGAQRGFDRAAPRRADVAVGDDRDSRLSQQRTAFFRNTGE